MVTCFLYFSLTLTRKVAYASQQVINEFDESANEKSVQEKSRKSVDSNNCFLTLSFSLSARSPGRPMTNTNLDKDTKFQSGMFKEDPGKHLRSESQIHLKSTKLPPKYIQSYAHMRGLSINFCEGYPSRRMIKHIFLCLL